MNAKNPPMMPYQSEFINFLIASGALTFGDFVTKSGRKTPYFVNTGRFNTGAKLSKFGSFYATHISNTGLAGASALFGPAYKGIPLVVATSIALHRDSGIDIPYSFDRKEKKTHGDGGMLVGYELKKGDDVVIIEDVITAGTTIREFVPALQRDYGVTVNGVVISIDRCERGTASLSAVQEVEKDLGVKVYPIATVHHIVEHLAQGGGAPFKIPDSAVASIRSYLKEYGA